MVQIPEELAQAMVAGDCVLWAGAGFGSLAGRPGWAQLCTRLCASFPESKRAQLEDLLEQGRLRTVLSYVHRHLGDAPLHEMLKTVSQESTASELPEGAETFAEVRWKACFATTYADVLYRIFAAAGKSPDVISHTDVHGLSLRSAKDMFILRTPPTGRSMRADKVFFELVEEAVRSRTFLYLGFDIDDPDLYQILELLRRIGRGNTHYAVLPFVTEAEAEELEEAHGLNVLRVDGELDLIAIGRGLKDACDKAVARPSHVDVDLSKLDLARALRGVETRADLALDFALGLELREIERLVDQVPGNLTGVDPSTLLRAGCVFLAHNRVDRARRCFQQVVSRGAGAEYQNIARFNLAFVSFLEGDAFAAVEGINNASEADRALAIVPPRFEIVEILGRDGTRTMFNCRDRETGEHLDISVAVLERPVSRHQQQEFYEEVQRLIPVEHPAIKKVRGGFADGRLFGVMSEPAPGFVLEDAIRDEDHMPLDRAVELLTPVLEGLALCHEQGIVHRNVTPRQILMTPEGSMLRGFGPPPVMSHHRASVRQATDGYTAPEVLAGAEPTPAADVYGVGAVLYRCLTGEAPRGGVPRPTKIHEDLDPRLDGLIEAVLDPDPEQRPPAGALAMVLGKLLTTPPPARETEVVSDPRPAPAPSPAPAPEPAAQPLVAEAGTPEAPHEEEATLTPPTGLKISAPEDPDDLEGWAWVLERKPTHIEARQNIERIEQESRDAGRWDRVADVLQVRAQHVQVQHERVELMRELAGLFERELGAPANAFVTLQALIEDVPVPLQVELIGDLIRLGGLTGNWSELAESITIVATRAPDDAKQAELYAELGTVYAEQLGAPDRAASAFEHATELQPEAHGYLARLPPLYRKLNRSPELAATLLSLAEMETGADRATHLLEASEVLQTALEDEEGAFAALEALRADDPDHAEATGRLEGLARSLGRYETLAEILSARADAAFDDATAVELRREVAELALEHLDDRPRAINELTRLLERNREDETAARKLVELLRAAVSDDPARRADLIDALYVMAELAPSSEEKATVLSDCAGYLDQEADGGDRAADCREQVITAVGVAHGLGRAAAESLEKYYRSADAHNALADLLRKQGGERTLELAERVEAYRKLLDVSRDRLKDDAGVVECLEALVELQPESTDWKDQLVARYLEAGELERAGPLIRARVDAEEDPKKKADLLIKGAKLRDQLGKTDAALSALEEALALDPERADGWIALRDLYRQNQQPLKAIAAQVSAANATGNRLEKTRMLFDAARACLDVDEPARASDLLEQVVELDPDHVEATELLLERLMETEELERAWPVAQTFVLQARARTPDDQVRNLRALSIAGRCALVVGDGDKAREYLEKAKALDATNLDVLRLLADLHMDAQNWNDALTNYQSVILGAGDSLPAAEQSNVYVKMARARVGMGEANKAPPMIERALELAPGNEPAARLGVELAADLRPADRVKARRRLLDVLDGVDSELAEPEARRAWKEEIVGLLREIAEIQAVEMSLPEEAIRTLEEVLELEPGDSATLHRMLELFTERERWRDATNVLERLAEAQTEGLAKSKYLYAGAVILRDQVKDDVTSLEWFRQVMASDPGHEKAYNAARDIMERTGDWHEVTRLVRERLKNLPDSVPVAERIALIDELGVIYETHLGDHVTALAAYEQTVALAPPAEREGDEVVAKRRKIMDIALELGGDHVDKAIEQAHGLIKLRPMEFDLYHRLVGLYAERGDHDRAIRICRTLKFLKQASVHEAALAERGEGKFVQARGTVTREMWRNALYHRRINPVLSDLFSIIWPMVAAREGRTHAHYGLKRDDREPVSLQGSSALSRFMAYGCQVLDAPVPDLFVRKESGGLSVGALAEMDGKMVRTVFPSVLAGNDATAKQPEPVLAFRVGRAVARARPEHILASSLPSAGNLRNAVFGALALTHPDAAIPNESHAAAREYAQEIQKYLPPARQDQLKAITNRIVESGALDTRAWLEGVAYTVTRAGFLLSDSLETAARIMSTEGDDAVSIPAKDRIKDLVSYSVSPELFELRTALKMK